MEGTPEEQGTLLPIQRKEGFTPSLHHRQRQSKTIPVLRSLSQIRKMLTSSAPTLIPCN